MLRTDYDTLLGAEPSGQCYHRMGLSDTDEASGEMGKKGGGWGGAVIYNLIALSIDVFFALIIVT